MFFLHFLLHIVVTSADVANINNNNINTNINNNINIAAHFGTKSRYEEVNPHLLADILAVNHSILRPPATERCSPVHVSALVRHGSRYPTVNNVRAIRKLSDLLRSQRPQEWTSWRRDILDGWRMWYTDDMDGELVHKGREDMRHLARRLSLLLPSLLGEEPVRRGRVQLLSSSKHRCVSSVEAFQEGLHLQAHLSHVDYSHRVDDQLLRSFERCPGYVEGVEKNHTALAEVHKFQDGQEMDGVRTKVADKLGLPGDSLTADLLEAAFFLCSYELAIKSQHSPWCFLFDQDDAQVLDYKTCGSPRRFWSTKPVILPEGSEVQNLRFSRQVLEYKTCGFPHRFWTTKPVVLPAGSGLQNLRFSQQVLEYKTCGSLGRFWTTKPAVFPTCSGLQNLWFSQKVLEYKTCDSPGRF
ncbi:multiple inositol polyphosphate phosphatase 1b isoform X2 [Nerophis lumbriciformis]|uniref:multiple inositol polyphosphate phosphatase 1b isoform X2 n=1 Tax=Nerophis lumbriciformis TaxID=546530 RepID=UPI002ADFF70A|nr:multiple inositol polyphosphate phosphatase 1-like isoform X2 [Nerophis lumbriciformis]